MPLLSSGDEVVIDDLPTRRVSGIKATIESAGAKPLYLPTYSPDFDLIEQVFVKLEALLRKIAARMFEDIWSPITAILKTFSAAKCKRSTS